jgi:DNA-binding NtrC family response regulator
MVKNSKYNLAQMEHQTIMAALRETEGNRTKAADHLGISVRTLRNKINLYRELGTLDRDENTGRLQSWFRKKRRKATSA